MASVDSQPIATNLLKRGHPVYQLRPDVVKENAIDYLFVLLYAHSRIVLGDT